MYKEPPPGLYIAADENDITKVCVSSRAGGGGLPYEKRHRCSEETFIGSTMTDYLINLINLKDYKHVHRSNSVLENLENVPTIDLVSSNVET